MACCCPLCLSAPGKPSDPRMFLQIPPSSNQGYDRAPRGAAPPAVCTIPLHRPRIRCPPRPQRGLPRLPHRDNLLRQPARHAHPRRAPWSRHHPAPRPRRPRKHVAHAQMQQDPRRLLGHSARRPKHGGAIRATARIVSAQRATTARCLSRTGCLLQPAVPSEDETPAPDFGDDSLVVRVEEGPQPGYRWPHRLVQQIR
jgi:hypothetical protein